MNTSDDGGDDVMQSVRLIYYTFLILVTSLAINAIANAQTLGVSSPV